MTRSILLSASVAAVCNLSCDAKKVQACHTRMTSAQAAVSRIDEKSLESTESALSALEQALTICRDARRHEEVAKLEQAQAEIAAHAQALRNKPESPAKKKLSPEELEQLKEHGDPNCPKGQAYKHQATDVRIKCSGPQIMEMSFSQAREYYKRQGYKELAAPENVVMMEQGAERAEFRYETANDENAPKCLILHPPPGMSWQEGTARATGIHPARLELNGKIKRGSESLQLRIDEKNVIIRLGDCND